MIGSKALIIAAFCLTATLASTPFKPCGKGLPTPSELRVEGCTAEPCNFYRGENALAEWDFTVVADTDNLKPEVIATAFGVPVKYPLPEQDACKSLTNGECPLDETEEVTYRLEMPILDKYPKISLNLQFSLVDDTGNVHVCFKLNAKVTDKP